MNIDKDIMMYQTLTLINLLKKSLLYFICVGKSAAFRFSNSDSDPK